MNFLELVQDLARDTGTLAGGVSLLTVVGATGRADKLKSWTNKAWRNIQNEQRDWLWMRSEFDAQLLPNTSRYTAASFNITRLGEWRGDGERQSMWLYDPALGANDATELEQVDYDDWRYRWDHRLHDATRPTEWAISPQQELVFGPTPLIGYTIEGEYQRSPQTLVLDTDIPEMPVKFHDLIVWEAGRLLNIADGAFDAVNAGAMETVTLREQLKREQLEPIREASYSIDRY